ncbi:MAG: hypothetical protein R3C44_14325 [Chloroflexota bacterium]
MIHLPAFKASFNRSFFLIVTVCLAVGVTIAGAVENQPDNVELPEWQIPVVVNNYAPTNEGSHTFIAAGSANQAFFLTYSYISLELWRTDGTTDGTYRLQGYDHHSPEAMVMLGDKAIYIVDTDQKGGELWVTDGTSSGTTMLLETDYQFGYSVHDVELVVAGDLAYFIVQDPKMYPTERLWRTDGTLNGTYPIEVPQRRPYLLTAAGDELYFAAHSSPTQIWKTDGTTAGREKVARVRNQ